MSVLVAIDPSADLKKNGFAAFHIPTEGPVLKFYLYSLGDLGKLPGTSIPAFLDRFEAYRTGNDSLLVVEGQFQGSVTKNQQTVPLVKTYGKLVYARATWETLGRERGFRVQEPVMPATWQSLCTPKALKTKGKEQRDLIKKEARLYVASLLRESRHLTKDVSQYSQHAIDAACIGATWYAKNKHLIQGDQK